MHLFRVIIFLFQLCSILYIVSSNENIILTDYENSFNKTYNGNITLTCDSATDNICNMTKVYCGRGDCIIKTLGSGKNILNNLFVDARNIQTGHKFELKCSATGQDDCKNITVLCPINDKTICKCSGCNYKNSKFICELGVGVYCSGARIITKWKQNNIWCDSGKSSGNYGGGIFGKILCNNINDDLVGCRNVWVNPTSKYNYYWPPNNKCIAVESNPYFSSYYNDWITYTDTFSCRKTINLTTNSYEFALPKCLKYKSKPDYISDLKQYMNITKIIIKNKTNIINKTRWVDQINYIDQNNSNNVKLNKNATNEEWNLIQIIAIGSTGLFGLCMMSILFYIIWHCYLKDNIEDMILERCCGNYGEYFLNCWECIGCINDWRERKEKREDTNEFANLTEKQIAIIKEARAYNQIKLDEAIKLNWEKYCVTAKKNELKYIALRRQIELSELSKKPEEKDEQNENTIIKILSETPERKQRRMEI